MPLSRVLFGAALIAALLCSAGSSPATAAREDPLSFFGPDVQLSDSQRSRLDEGEAIAKTLPSDHHELAVVAVGLTSATPDALVRSVEDIVRLKKSSYVPEIGRFSNPPRLSDLNSLTLDSSEADAIKDCRPDHCDLKLSAAEIDRLQRVIARNGNDWRRALQDDFRQLILDRVRSYLRQGERGIGPYVDRGHESLPRIFSQLLAHSPSVTGHATQLGRYLEQYPARRPPGTDTFLYWSKETFAPHPIVSVTHVAIRRALPRDDAAEAIVVSRDVCSTRYVSGAIAMTVLLPAEGGKRYLGYVNHTWVDDVYWLWRPIVEYRVKTDAAKAFAQARARIEAAE